MEKAYFNSLLSPEIFFVMTLSNRTFILSRDRSNVDLADDQISFLTCLLVTDQLSNRNRHNYTSLNRVKLCHSIVNYLLSLHRLSRLLWRRLLKHLSPSSRRRRALRKPSVAWPAALNDMRCFCRRTVLAAVPIVRGSVSELRLSPIRDVSVSGSASLLPSSSWSDLVLRCHATNQIKSNNVYFFYTTKYRVRSLVQRLVAQTQPLDRWDMTCYTRVHTFLPSTKHELYLPLLPS